MDDFLIPRSRKFLIAPDDSLDALRYLLPPPTDRDIVQFRKNACRAKALAAERDLLTVCCYGMIGDLACWLCGMQELMMLTIYNPDFVQQLLNIIEDWNRRCMEVAIEEGIDLFVRRAWYENADVLPPSEYRQFILPTLRRDIVQLIRCLHFDDPGESITATYPVTSASAVQLSHFSDQDAP